MLEGQLTAQLGHTSKHIVKVLDHGVLPVRAGGEVVERPFLVMEHLAGDSLAHRLRTPGAAQLVRAATCGAAVGARKICEARAADECARSRSPAAAPGWRRRWLL